MAQLEIYYTTKGEQILIKVAPFTTPIYRPSSLDSYCIYS